MERENDRRLIGRNGALHAIKHDLAADHQAREVARGGVLRVHGADGLAAAQHGDAVRDRHDLVQLVGDENDGATLADHGAQGGEQNVGLLRGENRGRLVEDEHLRAAVENLQDLDALLLADGELPHLRARVHRQAVSVGEFLHARLDRLGVQHEGGGVVAEDDVLGDGER